MQTNGKTHKQTAKQTYIVRLKVFLLVLGNLHTQNVSMITTRESVQSVMCVVLIVESHGLETLFLVYSVHLQNI